MSPPDILLFLKWAALIVLGLTAASWVAVFIPQRPCWRKWLTLLPAFATMRIAADMLAETAVRRFSTPDKKHLTFPFRWMDTDDNDLGGDEGWRSEHIEPGSDPYSDENRIGWMKRNGGHHAAYYLFGVPAPGPVFRPFWPLRVVALVLTLVSLVAYVATQSLWAFAATVACLALLVASLMMQPRYLDLFVGWKGNEAGRSGYVFTVRIKTKP